MAGATIGTAYVQILPSAEGIKGKLTEALGGEAEKAGKGLGGKLGAGLKTGLKATAVAAGAAIAAVGAATVAIGKKALESYADYEQLVGGVETLFGTTQDEFVAAATASGMSVQSALEEYKSFESGSDMVMRNAAEAYKTAGMSANDYMETVTSFSASLLQSLGGDTIRAASYADMAITDMADNANKMGSDISSIQAAYQGFAKQNYTMLDNLKLGYGGTKTEMERLILDAENLDSAFTASRDKNGELTMSYADIVDAIHIVQTEMGITGTTAQEASSTISGSLSSVSAAWSNLLTGLASDEANLDTIIDNFIESVMTAADNILPRIGTIMGGIAQLISTALPEIIPVITQVINENLPMLIDAGIQIMMALLNGLISAIPQLAAALPGVISSIVESITTNLPLLIDAGIQVLMALVEGIVSAIPQLVAALPAVITALIGAITSAIPQILLALTDPGLLSSLVDAAIEMMFALANGLIAAIPVLLEAAPQIIQNLIDGIMQNLPTIIEAAIQLIQTLTQGLIQNLPMLIQATIEIIMALTTGLLENLPMIIQAAIELILALTMGLIQAIPQLIEAIPQIIEALINAIVANGPQLIEAGLMLLPMLIIGIVQALGGALGPIGEKMGEWVSTAREKVTEFGNSISEGLTAFIGQVGGWINDNIVQPMKDAISSMVSVGSEVVDNLLQGIKDAWSTLTSWITEAWNRIKGIFHVQPVIDPPAGGSKPEGFATGLDYVPYDEFPAILHKGEAVLTAEEAAVWRNGGTGGGGGIIINQNIQSVPQTPVQLASATAAYFEQARWAI